MEPVVGAQPVPLIDGLNKRIDELTGGKLDVRPSYVAWSPDGSTIAFKTRWENANSQTDIWTIRSDGTDLREIFTQKTRTYLKNHLIYTCVLNDDNL